MTKGPACRAALQLPEILEQIVCHLPGHIILACAQRVSKLWRDVIDTSPIVQKRLWMRPLSAHISSPTGISTEQDTHIHRPMPNLTIVTLSSNVPIYPGSFHINTLFPRLYSRQARRDNRRLPDHLVRLVVLPQGKFVTIGIDFPRPKVSANTGERLTWLNMHLTEPPITTAWIQLYINDFSLPLRKFGRSVPATVRDIGGLTFGSVIDAVDRMIAQPAYMSLTDSISVRICFVADDVEVVLPIPESSRETLRRGARAW
jgi:hypothetical protein